MTLKSLYLAGPMRDVPGFNFASFAAARERLRTAGWTVYCPAERDEQLGFDPTGLRGTEDLAALGIDLHATLDRCFTEVLRADAVALLPGWARSEGARAEALVAILTGRPLFQYFQHRPSALEPLDGVRVITRVETLQ